MIRFIFIPLVLSLGLAAVAAEVQLDVPFLRQKKKGCGAASVAMVLHYWDRQYPALGVPVDDLTTVHERLYSTDVGGTLLSDMRRYFEEAGFHAFTLRATWAELEEHLSKKRPLIVGLKKGSGSRATLHYAVVVGLEGKRVWLNDPARRGRKALKRSTFEKRWESADHWMLLAVPSESPSGGLNLPQLRAFRDPQPGNPSRRNT